MNSAGHASGTHQMSFRLHSPNLLRQRKSDHGRVTFVELFFDLVFVFAVTQLSQLLLEQLTRSACCRRCCC